MSAPRVRLVCAASFLLGVVLALLAMALTPGLTGTDSASDGAWTVFARTWTGAGRALEDVPRSGLIEAVGIPLANPDGVFPDRDKRLHPADWVFEDVTENRLVRFLNACDLRPVERATLLDRRSWRISDRG